jgi:hypothetical protein
VHCKVLKELGYREAQHSLNWDKSSGLNSSVFGRGFCFSPEAGLLRRVYRRSFVVFSMKLEDLRHGPNLLCQNGEERQCCRCSSCNLPAIHVPDARRRGFRPLPKNENAPRWGTQSRGASCFAKDRSCGRFLTCAPGARIFGLRLVTGEPGLQKRLSLVLPNIFRA